MAARGKARKRALDILFEADARAVPVGTVLAEQVRRREAAGEGPLNDYTVTIVEGVRAHQAEIDATLVGSSHGWTLERMPLVDRAILQVAVFEIAFAEDIPDAVAISEAVRLATDLSTDESPQFVNGVLAAVAASSHQSS